MKTAVAVGTTALIAVVAVALVAAFQRHVASVPAVGSYLPK